VRTNFDEIVNDPTKDVLLALDAPWCDVCKTVIEKLEEVAVKVLSLINLFCCNYKELKGVELDLHSQGVIYWRKGDILLVSSNFLRPSATENTVPLTFNSCSYVFPTDSDCPSFIH